MRIKRGIATGLAGVVALLAAVPMAAQVPEVAVSAVAEYGRVPAGTPFRVAVRLGVPDGWHIYWINPGAGGLPTASSWRLPAGVTLTGTEWPYPETDDAGGDVTNVYRGGVVFFSAFEARAGASGSQRLVADLSWGICKTICIQQRRSVSVVVRVAPGPPERTHGWSEMEAARSRLPVRQAGARFIATAHGGSVQLTVTGLKAGPPAGSWVTFFPTQPRRPSVVAPVRRTANGIEITLPLAVLADTPARVLGVLVGAHRPGAAPPFRAIAVDAAITR